MSTPRSPLPSDAVVCHGERPVGALLLPEVDPEDFVREFNQTYRSIGLSIKLTNTGGLVVSKSVLSH